MAIRFLTPLWSPNYTLGGNSCKGITIHHAAGTNFDAIGATFQNTARQTSAHWAVGPGYAQQFVDERNIAWHAGNWTGNSSTIGIECLNSSGDPYWGVADETIQTLAELMAQIARRHGMGRLQRNGNVWGHRDWSATYCPGVLYDKIDKICAMANAINEGKAPQVVNGQNPGSAVNNVGIHYRAHVMNLGWLPSVRDGQVAGTVGNAYQLEAFKVSPPEGVVLDVSVHIANVGWKTWKGVQWIKDKSSGEGSSANDPILGTVGKAQGVEAVAIKVAKNPTGKKLKYRVHVSGYGWTGWIDAPYACGTVGIGKPIEAIQMKFV